MIARPLLEIDERGGRSPVLTRDIALLDAGCRSSGALQNLAVLLLLRLGWVGGGGDSAALRPPRRRGVLSRRYVLAKTAEPRASRRQARPGLGRTRRP